jgi:hypothetical protein
MSDLVYVYAVLPAAGKSGLAGIDARRVRFVNEGALAAAVSDVPAEDFEEEPLNERVRDMGWLGPRAVAHQEVNDRLHESADATIPLAFGTVFRDDDRVRQLLREQSPALAKRLEMVRGCAEWVVALHLLREPDSEAVAQASTAIQDLRAEIGSSSPGRAHLLRRRLAELQRDEARRLQAQAAEDVLADLRTTAVDVYTEPLPTDTVERPLRARWPEPTYRLLVTGPWPPYRFGGLKAQHV